MGFLNPIFLVGMLAAAVPLLIHLWSRRQAKTVNFGSLMFLLVAHRQNVRRIQLKNLLILFLRMAIIILIAMALARPLLKNQFSFAGARTKTSAVIILDNSYSMAYQAIQGGRFEKAKKMALEVAQSLRRGDSAAVILMSDIAEPLFRKLTKDLNQAKEAIGNTQISYRPTRVPPSLEVAHDILEASNDPNKEIYLISDFNQNGWKNWNRVPNQSNARIFLLSVDDKIADNISIEEIRASSQLIGAHLPIQLEVSVSNHSDAPSEEITLTLFVDDQKRRSIKLQPVARESMTSIFTHHFKSPGTHTGYLELTADRLTIDNRRYFALDTYGRIRVLCVGDRTLYLMLALDPAIEQRPNADYTILPSTTSATALENLTLTEYDVLVLADVPELSDRLQQRLQAFMREGKSVIYFVGDNISAANYNAFADWLPVSFGQPITWRPPLTLSNYQVDSPIFEIFKSEDFAGQYAPQFYRGLALKPAENATNLAQLSDGSPFLIERSIDWGRGILFNVSATQLEASNLLVNPHFLPLLQQTVLYAKAVQSTHQKNLLVGQSYVADYRQSGAVTARVGRVGDATNSLETVLPGENGAFMFSGTNAPGIYQIEVAGRNQLLRDFFAVNVDARESELKQISIREAADRIGAQTDVMPASEALDQTLNAYRVGKEIWSELLLIALLLMLVEGVLSNHARGVSDNSVPSRA